jgi:hypothetical protein
MTRVTHTSTRGLEHYRNLCVQPFLRSGRGMPIVCQPFPFCDGVSPCQLITPLYGLTQIPKR